MHYFSVFLHHRVTNVVVSGEETLAGITLNRLVIGSAAARQPEYSKNRDVASAPIRQLVDLLRDFLDGKAVEFSTLAIDVGKGSQFRNAVLEAAQKIPYGTTWSYSELAGAAGYSAAVRAVASVMRNNPLPIIIPCHRVIRKSGERGGFCGVNSGNDATLKKSLLQLEATVLKKAPEKLLS